MFDFPFATHKIKFAHFLVCFCRDFQKFQILSSTLKWFFVVIYIKFRFANALPNKH